MKKVIISLMSLILIIAMCSSVYAVSGSVVAGASTDILKKGETFTINIVGAADTPIDKFYTKFSYDTNVLKLESLIPGENYNNNSSSTEIYVENNSEDTSPTSTPLCTMTFKVLNNKITNNTIISFSESKLHLNEDGTVKEIAVNIEEIELDIEQETGSIDEDKEGSTEDKTTEEKDDKGKKDEEKLPQTGIESLSLISITILGIISIISYILYRKYRNI